MKRLITASLMAMTIALTGCGGGGSGSSDTTTNTTFNNIKMCVPATFTANTFRCATECNASEYEQDFYSDTASCQTAGAKWIAEYNRNDTPRTAEQSTAYNFIDAIRQNVGVSPLKYDSRLEEATRLHELYLGDVASIYNVNMTHYEDNITYPSVYYRGNSGTDRANVQGNFWYAGDVISYGEPTPLASINALLTAIYHRLFMLENYLYRVGINSTTKTFAEPQLFGAQLDKIYFLKALSTDIGVYPYDGQTNVQTTFDNRETPDPLPNTTASVGNPISVQLNDAKVTAPTMVSFRLFYDANGTEITDTTILDQLTDPNGRFTAYEFALFANAPLTANTAYRAEFQYVDGGVTKTKVWRFTTGL